MLEEIGKSYGAYMLEQRTQLKELDSIGYVFRHNKTKARVVVVSNKDDNKVFSIGFRTPPTDDTGVPHIMEHSVLCGSKKFPAKDPFVELVKGSLNTFLNAMTYPDKTVYPVASCNDKDFHNLMHVYLDAVFYPNIYQKPQILMQEGWHYEAENIDSPIIYNGVVYNEMKGVFSSPDGKLSRLIKASLLKGTPYEFESGGAPESIPDLTSEDFLNFHRKYYHPSNSYIYLYGDMDVMKDLEWMDREYLSQFDSLEIDSSIPLCEPSMAEKRVVENYSISQSDTETDNTYLSWNVAIGTSLDKELYLAFQILEYALFSCPGAPIRRAFLEEKLGKDMETSYDNGVLQPMFSVIIKNANLSDEDKFLQVLYREFEKIAKNGIDRRSLEAAINHFEFKYKEANFGRYPKGLIYGLQMFDSWLYDDEKPFLHLQTEDTFAFLKENIDSGYFEQLIEVYFLKNDHKSIVILQPQKGLDDIEEEKVREKLLEYEKGLSKEEKQKIVDETKALKEYQDEPSTKEELLSIPMLEISDIKREIQPLINKKEEVCGIEVVHNPIFTNKIFYTSLEFRLCGLTEEQISFASLLTYLYRYMDTKKRSYYELASDINIETGGISTGVSVYNTKDRETVVYFDIGGKSLEEKSKELITLMEEIIFDTSFDDKNRLKEILEETKSRIQLQLPAQGHSVSANRVMSYFSKSVAVQECISGIGFYTFIVKLLENYEEKADWIVEQLEFVRSSIFQKQHMIISCTVEKDVKQYLEEGVKSFAKRLYADQEVKEIEILPSVKNEGFQTASQVQYVATGGNFVDAGFEYTGALKVLQVMFSYDYLWNKVRVKGGAYGCMCSFQRTGDAFFASYRDPNLMETYHIYEEAWKYVKDFQCDNRDMTKYIIGAIGNMDTPLTPRAKGTRSFLCYILGITEEDLQKERLQVIETTQETIRGLADLVHSVTKNGYICAVGGEEKLKKEEQAFKELKSIF